MNIKEVKKLLLTLLLVSLLGFTFTNPTEAQQGEESLQSIEQERTNRLETQLGLTIPAITDNPNHVITFTDPSSEKAGVQLEIDGQGFREITSPYTLPSLGIGRHVLTFRFTDTEDTRQTLEKILVVVPRPPVINAPTGISTQEITLKGTALIGSTVDIFLAGGTTHLKAEAAVQADGTWSHTFEGEFPLQVYNLVAITKRNGFASSFSETIVFELSEGDVVKTPASNLKPVHFAFRDINSSNIGNTIRNNLDLLYLSITLFALGIIVSSLFTSANRKSHLKRVEGQFQQIFNKRDGTKDTPKGNTQGANASSKKLTLREKFEQAGLAKKEESTTSEKLPEEKDSATPSPEENTMSKEEFMEKFQEQDPDDEKGRENSKKTSKKNKKRGNVKVTLT